MHCLRRLWMILPACAGVIAGLAAVVPAAIAADWRIVDSVANENTYALAVAPVFNQRVVFGIPNGWKPAGEKTERDTYTMDFAPEKQAAGGWREQITLQGFRGMAKSPAATPKGLLAQVAAEVRKGCGEKSITLSLGDTKVDSRDAHGAIIGCAGPPAEKLAEGGKGLGEIAFYFAIRGSQDMYVIQRSIRTDEFKKADAPINGANVHLFFRQLQPVKLCDLNMTEIECVERKSR